MHIRFLDGLNISLVTVLQFHLTLKYDSSLLNFEWNRQQELSTCPVPVFFFCGKESFQKSHRHRGMSMIAQPGRVPEEASSAQPFRVWLRRFQGEIRVQDLG